MPQSTPPRPSANPGGERGLYRSDASRATVPGSRRPQTAAQRALNPGRVAHAASEARGQSRGRAQGVGIGATLIGSAMAIKGAYDNQMAENAKFNAFNRGKAAGRQTDSAGRSTSPVGKNPKETYKAPVTKALLNDGRKPVVKPK